MEASVLQYACFLLVNLCTLSPSMTMINNRWMNTFQLFACKASIQFIDGSQLFCVPLS